MRSSSSRPFQSAGRRGATVPARQCRGSRSAASIRPMTPPCCALLVEVQDPSRGGGSMVSSERDWQDQGAAVAPSLSHREGSRRIRSPSHLR